MIKIHLSRILGERRMSQRKLAEEAKLRPATINAIYNESSKRLDLDVLDRICDTLEIEIGELIEHIPNKQKKEGDQ
jgi:putative transcriptional regulator